MENIVRSTETNGRSPERFAEQAKAGQAFYETWRARAEKLARISALALALGPVPDSAEARDLSIVESDNASLALSSGEKVVLPSFKGMEAPRLHVPKEGLADQLIVLFPQVHAVTENQMSGSPAYSRWDLLHQTLDSQTLIYNAIREIAQRKSLAMSKVCDEGLTDDSLVKYMEVTNETAPHSMLRALAPYFLKGYRIKTIADELAHYEPESVEYETAFTTHRTTIQSYTDRYKLLLGASSLAAGDGYTELCAPEDATVWNRLYQIREESSRDKEITEAERAKIDHVVFTERENAVLDSIARRSDSVIGLTFGTDHDFLDNISEWNEANPNHQYAIVRYDQIPIKTIYQNELEREGLSRYQIEVFNYAFQITSRDAGKLSQERVAKGIAWLKENAEKNLVSEDDLSKMLSIIGAQR